MDVSRNRPCKNACATQSRALPGPPCRKLPWRIRPRNQSQNPRAYCSVGVMKLKFAATASKAPSAKLDQKSKAGFRNPFFCG